MGRNSGEPAVRRVIFLGCDLPPYKIVADSPSDDTRAPRLPRDWSLDLVFSALDSPGRLDKFHAAILPYDAFVTVDSESGFRFRSNSRDRRLKEIVNLLKAGGVVCFLLDWAPTRWVSRRYPGDLVGGGREQTLSGGEVALAYPAAVFLGEFGLELAEEFDLSAASLHVERPEFKAWLDGWGGGRYDIEVTREEDARAVVRICSIGNKDGPLGGCALPCASGHIVVLQWAPGGRPHEELGEAMLELARALLKFRDNVRSEPPAWVADFVFEKERPLLDERKDVQFRLAELDSELKRFADYKSLLYLRDYKLQRKVPDMLERVGVEVERVEGVDEDFWIREGGNRAVICEVKGVNDNVTKMHVAQVDNHRKQNKLADTFPGLLVVNTLATAKSFREKEQEVHPDVSDRAAQENVLVLRTLDLFWLLDAVDAGQLQPCHLVKVFTSKKGWLKVEPGDACQALQE